MIEPPPGRRFYSLGQSPLWNQRTWAVPLSLGPDSFLSVFASFDLLANTVAITESDLVPITSPPTLES